MGRITSGKLRLDVQQVDLHSVVEEALSTARPAAEAKSIRLQKVLDSNLIVAGDPNRLQQVCWNLLSNAFKFTPKDGFVRVVMHRVDSHVEVKVVDSGQGMRQEFIARAFDKFSQSDAANVRKTGGLGLGLSIVRHLVEMHGGTIAASSEGEGKGSTFSVSLPLSAASSDQVVCASSALLARPLGTGAISLSRVKVLVVDDERDAREMLKRLLTYHGADVSTAGSADDAIEVLLQFQPHLLISDIGLPGEDGYELIRRVRMLGGGVANTKAVALTAFGRLQDRTQAMLAGFQMHLAKPVDPNELVVTVASITGSISPAAQPPDTQR
jgi:CheY-like chemotaxis protein/two-component sensor histidine kinase